MLFIWTYVNHYLKNGLSTALGKPVIGMCLTAIFEITAGLTIREIKEKADKEEIKGAPGGALTTYMLSLVA